MSYDLLPKYIEYLNRNVADTGKYFYTVEWDNVVHYHSIYFVDDGHFILKIHKETFEMMIEALKDYIIDTHTKILAEQINIDFEVAKKMILETEKMLKLKI